MYSAFEHIHMENALYKCIIRNSKNQLQSGLAQKIQCPYRADFFYFYFFFIETKQTSTILTLTTYLQQFDFNYIVTLIVNKYY